MIILCAVVAILLVAALIGIKELIGQGNNTNKHLRDISNKLDKIIEKR